MDELEPEEKVAQFQTALDRLIERVAEDRYVLAVVLVGSLSPETIWNRESIGLWIIEADGVSRRLRSDGNDERVYRTLVENGINIHAQVISRSRFKMMVEGASRTAFSCNFFSHRKLVYSNDHSIDNWFESANQVATKDRDRELLTFSTWTIHAHRHAQKRLTLMQDIALTFQSTLEAAHSVAYTEIIRIGQVWEQDAIYKAIEVNPRLFQLIYLNVLADPRDRKTLESSLDGIDAYLDEHHTIHLKPLLQFLKKESRAVPLSEISDTFAFSSVYPWHIESACEWLERKGRLQKLSAPFKLTKRSHEPVEEPAYFLDSE
jgi:uncharacterized protein